MQHLLTVANDEIKSSIIRFVLLRIVRIIRVLRVLKVTRYFRELRAITYSIYASATDFANVLLMSTMVLVVFSSLTYLFEHSLPNSTIDSIPQAMWWALCTYTTVGLGDTYPLTVSGKFVGVLCMLSGMVCLGIPAYRLVDNFLIYWTAMKKLAPDDSLMDKLMKSIKGLSLVKGTLEK